MTVIMIRPTSQWLLSLACLSFFLGNILFTTAAPSPQKGLALSRESLLPLDGSGLTSSHNPHSFFAPHTPLHLPHVEEKSLLSPSSLSLGDGLLGHNKGTSLGEKLELPSYHDTPFLDSIGAKKKSKEIELGNTYLTTGEGGYSHNTENLEESCHSLCAGVGGHGWLRGSRVCVCELKPEIYKDKNSLFASNKVKARELGLLIIHTLERRNPKYKRTRRCADIDELLSNLNSIGRSQKGSGLRLNHKGLSFPHKEVDYAARKDEIKKLQEDFLNKLKYKQSGARAVKDIEPVSLVEDAPVIGAIPLGESVPLVEDVPLAESVPALPVQEVQPGIL